MNEKTGGDNAERPVPINRRIIPPRTTQKSLADKVGASVAAPRKKQTLVIAPMPLSVPREEPVFHKTFRKNKPEQESKPVVSLVPINRKVVKSSPIKHFKRDKAEATSPTTVAVPINRKIVKPRTSDVFIHSDSTPRKDVIKTFALEKEEPRDNTRILRADQDTPAPTTPIDGVDKAKRAPSTHQPSPLTKPLQGKWPDQNKQPAADDNKHPGNSVQMIPVEGSRASRNIATPKKARKSVEEELQMVPVEGGRAYQDKTVGSKEADHRQRDVAPARKPASHRSKDPDMAPNEGSHRERALGSQKIEKKNRPENTLVRENAKAAKPEPDMVREPSRRKQQVDILPRHVKPEIVVRKFLNDLRAEADRQDYSVRIETPKQMQLEFASHSKALTVAFEKHILPFDRIIVKQDVPKHLERRRSDSRIGKKPGIVRQVKAFIGIKKMAKRKNDRRIKALRTLIGQLCESGKRVVDWQVAPYPGNLSPLSENRVAVSARYRIQGDRNSWTVQLVQDANAEASTSLPALSESRIKKSLLVLLDGLGDVIYGDLIQDPPF